MRPDQCRWAIYAERWERTYAVSLEPDHPGIGARGPAGDEGSRQDGYPEPDRYASAEPYQGSTSSQLASPRLLLGVPVGKAFSARE